MKRFKKIMSEIDSLRKKHGKDRTLARPFPDLSVPKRGTPTTNSMHGSTTKKGAIPGRKEFPVGNLHKSSLQMITPAEDARAYAGNKVVADGYQTLLNILKHPEDPIDG